MDGLEMIARSAELVARGADAERRIAEGEVDAALELAAVDVELSARVEGTADAAGEKPVREHRLLILQEAARSQDVCWDEVERAVDTAELPALVLDDRRQLIAREEDWEWFLHERAIRQLTSEVAPIVSMILLLHGIEDADLTQEMSQRCAVRAAGVFPTPDADESLTAHIASTIGATLRRRGVPEAVLADELADQCGRFFATRCPVMKGLFG